MKTVHQVVLGVTAKKKSLYVGPREIVKIVPEVQLLLKHWQIQDFPEEGVGECAEQ